MVEGLARGCGGCGLVVLAGASGRLLVEEGPASCDVRFDDVLAFFASRARRAFSARAFLRSRSEALPMVDDVRWQESPTRSP